MENDELLKAIEDYRDYRQNEKRRHATFFYLGGKYKDQAEELIAKEFLPSFELFFDISVDEIKKGDDPPDIVFVAKGARKFAIEITELVEPEAIRAQIDKNDTRYAAVSYPPLTTIRQPAEAMGARIIEELCAAIEDDGATSEVGEVVPHQLVVRKSVARV